MGNQIETKDEGFNLTFLGVVCELFGVSCADSDSKKRLIDLDNDSALAKLLDRNDQKLVIGRDLVAFIFIIFQLRILHSHFFQRCAIDYRCELVQASR